MFLHQHTVQSTGIPTSFWKTGCFLFAKNAGGMLFLPIFKEKNGINIQLAVV